MKNLISQEQLSARLAGGVESLGALMGNGGVIAGSGLASNDQNQQASAPAAEKTLDGFLNQTQKNTMGMGQ